MNKISNKDIQISKNMSYLLRHGALKEKINIRSDGFVLINELLQHRNLKGNSLDDIKRVFIYIHRLLKMIINKDIQLLKKSQNYILELIKVILYLYYLFLLLYI